MALKRPAEALDASQTMDCSYGANSAPQRSSSHASVDCIRAALQVENLADCLASAQSPLCVCVYGSGPGCNDFVPVSAIIDGLRSLAGRPAQINVVLNDLPENDFKSLFSSLAHDENSYQQGRQHVYSLVSGASFYEQIVPANSVHVGYSANSMHWLKTVPDFLGCCSFMNAVDEDLARCRALAKKDWLTLLQHRAAELAPGGLLILSNNTVDSSGKTPIASFVQLMYDVGKSHMSEEELRAFSIPHYWRSPQEVEDAETLSQCGLRLVQPSQVKDITAFADLLRQNKSAYAEKVVGVHRAWSNIAVLKAFSTVHRSPEDLEMAIMAFWDAVKLDVAANPEKYPCSFQQCYTILQKV